MTTTRPTTPSCIRGRRRLRPCRRRTTGRVAAPLLLPLLLLLLLSCPSPALAGIHVSHVVQDGRALIPLSPNFGFDPRGGGSAVVTLRAPLIVYRAQPPAGVDPVPPNR
jgi:hypothetical protein